MKILKYLLFVIIGLVIVFFAVGLLMPTVHYGYEITVDKPLKEAWAVSQDESKFDQWLKGFKSINLISGEPGKVGSKYKVVVNPGEGQNDFEMVETVVSVKEFEHIEMHFDSDMMQFEQKAFHSELNGKTVLRTENTVRGKSLPMRSMFALMELFGGAFEKQEGMNMEALKKVIEENTTDY